MKKLDLKGIELFDNDSKRVRINEEFLFDELNKFLYENWVPTVSCDKCARSDYCKYAKEESEKSGLPIDKMYIKCGVVAGFLRNFVNGFFDLLVEMNARDLQKFFDGLWSLKEFVWESETYIGTIADDYSVDWYKKAIGEDFGFLFTGIIKARSSLDEAAKNFSSIESIGFVQKILFVEGWSEKIFVEKIRSTRFIGESVQHYPIKVYDGKDNIRARIHELMKDLSKNGYEIYLQADLDGKKPGDSLCSIVKKKYVKEENIFCFKYDFEMSFPPKLMYETLTALNKLEGVPEIEFCKDFESNNSSFEDFKKKYQLEVSKTSISVAAANILSKSKEWRIDFALNEDCELWQFVNFIKDIR